MIETVIGIRYAVTVRHIRAGAPPASFPAAAFLGLVSSTKCVSRLRLSGSIKYLMLFPL